MTAETLVNPSFLWWLKILDFSSRFVLPWVNSGRAVLISSCHPERSIRPSEDECEVEGSLAARCHETTKKGIPRMQREVGVIQSPSAEATGRKGTPENSPPLQWRETCDKRYPVP